MMLKAMRFCEILEVEVFLYFLLVGKCVVSQRKNYNFLKNFTFIDSDLLSLKGPSYLKSVVLGMFSNL